MKTLKKKGFTLIELLVVITIIGILATGGVAVYSSYIQKARDTTRISDQQVYAKAIEGFYQDSADGQYPVLTGVPATDKGILGKYIQGKGPKDAKTGQRCTTGTANPTFTPNCGYFYAARNTNITNDSYNLSIGFESTANVDSKAVNDGGVDPVRYEIGTNMGTFTAGATGAPVSGTAAAVEIGGWM